MSILGVVIQCVSVHHESLKCVDFLCSPVCGLTFINLSFQSFKIVREDAVRTIGMYSKEQGRLVFSERAVLEESSLFTHGIMYNGRKRILLE